MMSRNTRPVALDLLRIRFPVPAVVSFLHRVSGVILFLGIPLAIYLLERSLSGAAGYQSVARWLSSPPMRLLGLLLAWAFTHHLLSGIRFLLLDLDIGVTRPVARASAWLVNGGAAAALLGYLGRMGGLW